MKFKAVFLKLILFLSFCPLINLQAQENYYSKTFTTESGLPHNHVYSIVQDSTGFLWIATWDGLSRYDGYEFKNYYHNPADTNSLAFFLCENVFVDFQNNVWVKSPGAISKYNRTTDNFTQFNFMVVGGMALDREGRLWCSTNEGIYFWDYTDQCFKTIEIEKDEVFTKAIGIYPFYIGFDNENRLWLIANTDYKLLYYRCSQISEKVFKPVFIGELDNRKIKPQVHNYSWHFEFLVSPSHEIYIISNFNIFKLDSINHQFLPVSITDGSVNPEIGQEISNKQKYYDINQIPDYLNGIFVETAFSDRQKTVWRGIFTNGSTQTGLTRTIQTPGGFRHYFTTLNPGAGLNAFFPVLKDKNGTVWAGAANTNAFFLSDKNGKESKLQPLDNETWLQAQRPRALLEDSTGIWAGYFQRLLLYYNFQNKQFEKIIQKKTDYTDQSIPHSFIHLKKLGDTLLIVGYKQICTYNIQTQKLTVNKTIPNDVNVNLYCVTPAKDGTWWVGGALSTLFKFDNHFKQTKEIKVTRAGFNIEDILIGENNDLWISTLGGGLVHFDIVSEKPIRIYTTADGLSNNTCYGMLKDKRGNIWISTNHGISRFNLETGKFKVFGQEDGLKIDEFNSDNTFLAPDGEMFFAGMGGVVSFYPDSVDVETGSQFTAPLLITDFKVSGISRYFKKAIYDADSISLNKGDNNFRVAFACFDFVNAQKMKYRYRLRGEDDKYTETDHRNRIVNYANLSPGKYMLEIEATNANGEWISKTDLFIEIPPYYYQTWWFRFLVVLIVVGVIGYFIFTYNRQLRLKARQQQDELKLESLRGQMNPHFIFNSLNSINYFISQNDRLAANRYIADFARLIRSILGNLSQEYIPLAKELESLNDYLQLEHLRFSDKFDYEISVEENIQTEEFMVFPGMVQPFIENAIWHGVRGLEGRKGFVKIRFFTENLCSLCCLVEDDGIGRKQSEVHKSTLPGKTSRGIGIVLERLKIINHLRNTDFKVIIEDLYPEKEESGTRVRVDIPVKS